MEACRHIDGFLPIAGLGNDLDVILHRRAACGSRLGPLIGRRRRARGCSYALAFQRKPRSEYETALWCCSCRRLPP